MNRYKALVAALGVGAILMMGVSGASADPVNAKNGTELEILCDTSETLTIATNGRGQWTPGLVTTNNQVGIPYAFNFTFTFTPPGGPPVTENEVVTKKAPRNGRLDRCTFSEEFTDPDGTSFVFAGIVSISFTPEH